MTCAEGGPEELLAKLSLSCPYVIIETRQQMRCRHNYVPAAVQSSMSPRKGSKGKILVDRV